jgi:membrane protein implicated in regulation of membrane protease activity
LLLLLLLLCYTSTLSGTLCWYVSLQPIHPQTPLLLLLLATFALLYLLRPFLSRLHKRRPLYCINDSNRDAVYGQVARHFWHFV